jgi:hypothetical protein
MKIWKLLNIILLRGYFKKTKAEEKKQEELEKPKNKKQQKLKNNLLRDAL